jgi:hypothetical protein
MNQYILYKPKQDKTGMAANFSLSDNGFFLSLAKQIPSDGEHDKFAWNDDAGKPKATISLGLPDIGPLLALFNGKIAEAKLYHEFEKAGTKIVTSLNATPYSSLNKKTNVVEPKGYSVNITRGGEKYGFGINFGEAEVLKVLLTDAIYRLTFVELKKKA